MTLQFRARELMAGFWGGYGKGLTVLGTYKQKQLVNVRIAAKKRK